MPEDEILSTWRKALGARDTDALDRRLQWDDVRPEDALAFLRCRGPDTSVVTFARIQAWLRDAPAIDPSDGAVERPQVPFADLWHRVAAGAVPELRKSLGDEVAAHYKSIPGGPNGVYRDVFDDLVTKLSAVAEPVVWEEFNRRRTPSQIITAHLGADGTGSFGPPRTIYCSFLEELRGDALRDLTDRYPVLRRHLCTTLDHWFQGTRDLLMRVHDDRGLLLRHFDLPLDARLTAIAQNLSDPHRGGRTVAVLTFTPASSPGAAYSLVYKPKDLRIDDEFQRLAAAAPLPVPGDRPLQSVAVLPRPGYGYMEFVPHRVCASGEELRSFYRNAGRLTAILYLLGATDCHHENLVARGDQLLLIDGETLFEGTDEADADATDAASPTERSGLYRRFAGSVIRLGLLPEWHFVADQRVARDVTALGITPPRSATREGVGWIALNTDGMISGPTEEPARLPTSLPVGTGSPNRLAEFVDTFCDGFEGQLFSISEHNCEWLGDNGLLARFRGAQRRFIARPTWLYLWLRKQQIEPGSLSSEVDQRLVLERLARSYLVRQGKPRNWPLLAAEITQMDELDVPVFEQDVGAAVLRAPGGLTIDDYFPTNGFRQAGERVAELDAPSVAFQSRIVRGVISARRAHLTHRPQPGPPEAANAPVHALTDDDRLEEATSLGRAMADTAIVDDNGAVEWLGIDVTEDTERSRYGPLGWSLYGGRSGIALFLASLARSERKDASLYRRLAADACPEMRSLSDAAGAGARHRWWRDQPLGLAGSGGILLGLVHICDLIPELRQPIRSVVTALLESLDVELLRSDAQLDIVNGGAGLIGALLRIGSPAALSLAGEAGVNLVRRQDGSGGWLSSAAGPTPLTGFSHGASGIAAALAALHSATGDAGCYEAAAAAVRYERKTFSSEAQNWPDFRDPLDPRQPRFMLSWCHGAPGVALSRLCMSGTALWDREAGEELNVALRATASPSVAGDSICCGRFGRAAILRMAARWGGEPRWLEAAAELEAEGVSGHRVNGTYSFLDRLGLFTGAAGVGLALLEGTPYGDPPLLPSILSAGLFTAALQR